jgi:hypothetical protein
MPSLTDLFNPTFLMFLGILVLVVALLVVYFESKMREQNHKITSMLSLVSSLAEELNGVKFGLNHLSMRGGVMPSPFIPPNHLAQNPENKLINVSDDEDSDEEGFDEEDELEDNESVSLNEDSDESDDESILDIDQSVDVKVLKLNIESNNDENENDNENILETEEFNDHFSDVESLSSKSSSVSLKQTSETIALEENKNDLSATEFKTININLEEQLDSLDYKKLPLTKLRSIVTEKGLSIDSNKLKKNELLKLLGVE